MAADTPLTTPAAPDTGCAHTEWRTEVNTRLDAGAERMRQIQSDLAENTADTRQVREDTREMVEFFRSMKGAFRVLELLGKAARPLGYIAAMGAAFVGLWAKFKSGGAG